MNMKKIILVFLVLLVLLAGSVQAVGLASWGPIVKKIDFIPNHQEVFSYMVTTTVDFTQDYTIFVEGDLAQYVTVTPSQTLENIAPGQDPWFNVIINFPSSEGNLTPGIHNIRIGIVEGALEDTGGVGGRTSVTTRIEVRILHPGKYLIADLDAPNVNINEPVRMNLYLENWGKQTINSAQGQIDVYTKESQFKDTISSNSVPVPTAGQAETYAVLDTAGYLPGDYYAEGIVNWDGQQTPVNNTFKIGTQDVKINSYTSTFEKDKINPLTINIESVWNSMTDNVYATLDFPNGRIQTPTITLQPWEKRNLTAYWDTSGVELGQYDAQLILHYADKTKSENVQVEVLEKVEVQEQKPLGFNYVFLIVVIIILILVNVFLWYFFIRKKKKTQEFPESQNF